MSFFIGFYGSLRLLGAVWTNNGCLGHEFATSRDTDDDFTLPIKVIYLVDLYRTSRRHFQKIYWRYISRYPRKHSSETLLDMKINFLRVASLYFSVTFFGFCFNKLRYKSLQKTNKKFPFFSQNFLEILNVWGAVSKIFSKISPEHFFWTSARKILRHIFRNWLACDSGKFIWNLSKVLYHLH